MDSSGRSGLGIELLNQSNYRVWRTCMESYLVGEDLWDVVNGNNTTTPANEPEDADALKKWKQLNAKAEFVLKRSISHGLFDHIMRCKSAHEIWQTLDRLFNKKDEARLQILENELTNTTQVLLRSQRGTRSTSEIDDHLSNLNPNDMETDVQQNAENIPQKKHTRGKTYMPRVWMMRDRKLVHFNKLGQPIGENKSKFVEFLGSLVRNGTLIPLDYQSWHKVPEDNKDYVLEIVKGKFEGTHGFKHWTLMNMGKKWKAWKNRVKDKFFDPNMSLEENLNKRPDSEDERVLPDQWKKLVIHWNSDAAREESARNKATRAKKRYNHITGKRSFAHVKEEMKRDAREHVRETRDSEEREGAENYEAENDVDLMDYEPSRVDLYGECYTKKGSTSNPVIAETWQKMSDLVAKLPAGAKDNGPDDIFSQVAGPDKWGRVRMVGSGIRASDFYDNLIPNQRASSRMAEGYKEEIETLKQVTHNQNRQLQEQSKQIQEQNKQIQELLRMSKQRFEYMESSHKLMSSLDHPLKSQTTVRIQIQALELHHKSQTIVRIQIRALEQHHLRLE